MIGLRFRVLLSVAAALVSIQGHAQTMSSAASGATTSTGSVGCAALTQAAATAVNERVQANDAYEKQPDSVNGLSCLSNFFNGTGLNLITNGLDPAALLQAVEGQIGGQVCQAAQAAWGNAMGSTQCGLSLSGVNLGLGFGSSSGLMCPSLSFGGGGPPIATAIAGTSSGTTDLYINGSPQLPTGYSLSNLVDGVF
ncbi:hypothetical protein CFR75_12010 [Komagataeibacter xylinus]|uniref:Secreted protein n=6 Tax=Acetobacteraceae TaxID=433 RepID=A0A9N7CXM3_9PROT|nr:MULTISPECIES: hypothetical protein [Acetobacteraceae]AQU87106.1 hypothetical protein B0W47_06025 [Komagataeibacter nataicola]KPH87927.1 hypothetical protein GLUCOINTEAF2_0204024 [Komagataeibacter intermedius AF2]PYD56214.1 hypothetical protein CFR75_12010 [Komagataeibacter xylinus]PYD65632.1 hypothetical protein CDI09_12520 [Komagataeibacter nataicola]PYD74585.1 hypothetical protein CFR71_14050 [Novacetimonas pomaceti]